MNIAKGGTSGVIIEHGHPVFWIRKYQMTRMHILQVFTNACSSSFHDPVAAKFWVRVPVTNDCFPTDAMCYG